MSVLRHVALERWGQAVLFMSEGLCASEASHGCLGGLGRCPVVPIRVQFMNAKIVTPSRRDYLSIDLRQ